MGIQFQTITDGSSKTVAVNVRLDGKVVGQIQPVLNGWRYFPKGQKEGSEVFGTITECERSLRD